jgi:hypothetical protein
MKHIVKIWPEYFDLLSTGELTSCVRKNDRNYQASDILETREINPDSKRETGRTSTWRITHVFHGDIRFGCDLGEFVVLSLRRDE